MRDGLRLDRLIRKHGYFGTPATLEAVENDPEVAANLSAAAHLIHGSSEGRFTITYCPAGLGQKEICDVGFRYGNLDEMAKKYDIQELGQQSVREAVIRGSSSRGATSRARRAIRNLFQACALWPRGCSPGLALFPLRTSRTLTASSSGLNGFSMNVVPGLRIPILIASSSE